MAEGSLALYGLGLSVTSIAARFISLPKPIAWGGFAGGITIVGEAALPTRFIPTLGPGALYVVGEGCLAAAASWQFAAKEKTPNADADAPKAERIQATRTAFSQTFKLSSMPSQLGGVSSINVDNVVSLRLFPPYSENSITLAVNMLSTRLPDTATATMKTTDARVSIGKLTTLELSRADPTKELTASGRTYVISLVETAILNVPNVSKPIEWTLAIHEK